MTRPRQPAGGALPPRRPPNDRPPGRPPARVPFGAQDRTAAPSAPKPARLRSTPERTVLWGFHAVLAAIESPRRKLLRLLATPAAAERVREACAARGLEPEIMEGSAIDALVPREAVHQGLVLEARPLPEMDLSELPDTGVLLVLDQITDPHNVGAMIRTAAAYGVTALVTTERHAPDLTGVLAKSASGGLEHVPMVHVVNLARALDALTRQGYAIVGLDSEGTETLEAVPVPDAIALVLGAEGKGLRRLTRERCTVVARLDMPGPIKSLNVSNACAVALATVLRRASPQ